MPADIAEHKKITENPPPDLKGLQQVYKLFSSALVSKSDVQETPLLEHREKKEVFQAAFIDIQNHFDQKQILDIEQRLLLAQIFAELGQGNDDLAFESQNIALKIYDEVYTDLLQQGRVTEINNLVQEVQLKVPISVNSPFFNIMQSLSTKPEQISNKGVYFTAGTSALRDNVLHVTRKTIEDDSGKQRSIVEIDGKLDSSTTRILQANIEKLQSAPLQGVEIKKTTLTYSGLKPNSTVYSSTEATLELGEVWEVSIKDVGVFYIGADPEYGNIFDRFIVVLEETDTKTHNEYGQALYSLLARVGLSQALALPSRDDKERAECIAVMWTFFPKTLQSIDAQSLRTKSLPELRTTFDAATGGKFSQQYQVCKIQYKEIDVGYKTAYVEGQAKEVKAQGGAFLTHGIRGGYNGDSWADSARFVHEKILQHGLIPSEDRFKMGIINGGLSPTDDHIFGGAGNIFTRLIPETALDKKYDVCEIGGNGSILLLIDLEVFEGRTYQYQTDCYGICNEYSENEEVREQVDLNWKTRDTASDFTRKLTEQWSNPKPDDQTLRNEVMVHKTVKSSEIYGLVVSSEEERKTLIDELSKYRKEINGVPLGKCILCAATLTSGMKREAITKG